MSYDAVDTDDDGTIEADVDNSLVNTDRVNNTIGDAALQAGWDGLVVPIGEGVGMVDAIDPSNTTTPVADAKAGLDALSNPSGTILLPPGQTDEGSQIDWRDTDAINLVGRGFTPRPGATPATTLNFTDGTDKGFLFSNTRGCVFRDFTVQGQKSGNSDAVFTQDNTGSLTSSTIDCVVDRLSVHTWYGGFIHWQSGGNPFQNSFGPSFMLLNDIDAGDETALINWSEGGRANTFGNVAINPDSAVSGFDTTIYDDTGGPDNEVVFDWLNLGGSTGKIAKVAGPATFNAINWEPSTQNSTPADLIELLNSPQFQAVWDIKLNSGTCDYVYNINGSGNTILTTPWQRSTTDSTINNTRVNVTNSPAGGRHSVYYFGQSSEITNNSGEANNSVRTMDTAGGGNA